MPYSTIPISGITKYEQDYQGLMAQHSSRANYLQQKALDEKMARIGRQANDKLIDLLKAAERHVIKHKANAAQWLTTAQSAYDSAKADTAAYKKAPTNNALAHQARQAVTLIRDYRLAYENDAKDLYTAWHALEDFSPKYIAARYLEQFQLERAQVVTLLRETDVTGTRLKTLEKEGQALTAILQKASMKLGIKTKTGTQRLIGVAQAEAADVASDLRVALNGLRTPLKADLKPTVISQGAAKLQEAVDKPHLLKTKRDLATLRVYWSKADTAYKALVTNATSMAQVLATSTKGFRSNELSDTTVKTRLAEAKQHVESAKSDSKAYTKVHAVAKKNMAAIETRAKQKGI